MLPVTETLTPNPFVAVVAVVPSESAISVPSRDRISAAPSATFVTVSVSPSSRSTCSTGLKVTELNRSCPPAPSTWIGFWPVALRVGASFTPPIATVCVAVTVWAPPLPWVPELPSENTQFSSALVFGSSLVLAYVMCCRTLFTWAEVAVERKVICSWPPPSVKVAIGAALHCS